MNEKAVKKAIDSFNSIKEKNYYISPISENDVAIMLRIIELSEREDIKVIMDNWKFDADTDIIDQLNELTVNTKAGKQIVDGVISSLLGDRDDQSKFIVIQNERIFTGYIVGYDLTKEWDWIHSYEKFVITLNPERVADLRTQVTYRNKRFTFTSLYEAEKITKILDKELNIKESDEIQ